MTTIEFVLQGQVDGIELSPRTIGLSQFNEFNQQVESFIAGSEKGRLDDVHVEVEEGSYKLRVLLIAAIFSALAPDLRALEREDSLGEIDPKRAEVVAKWQARSKADPELSYEIRAESSHDQDIPTVRLSRDTDFRIGEIEPWVSVEKYLFGTILDMGGAQKANVHLRLKGESRLLKIGTSQGYLEEQVENRLYHQALVHVRAKQHYRTGELRDVQLIGFVDYQPQYDEAALDRFAEVGRQAWADIPDAAAWVRQLRGGS